TSWSLAGDYFESCNCSVLCPCLISTSAPMTARPTEGDCHVALLFHINQGAYGEIKLDGLNLVVCASSDGPMGQGHWTGATYVDEGGGGRQGEGVGGIFSGGAGGPMAAFAPLFGESLGLKEAPITFKIDGKVRSGEIPGVLSMSVEPLPTLAEGGEIWAETGH